MSVHVFVVRGDLANLDCDAVVVPSDRGFTVEPTWNRALGLPADGTGAARLRPAGWPRHGTGREQAGAAGARPPLPTWFVDAAF